MYNSTDTCVANNHEICRYLKKVSAIETKQSSQTKALVGSVIAQKLKFILYEESVPTPREDKPSLCLCLFSQSKAIYWIAAQLSVFYERVSALFIL